MSKSIGRLIRALSAIAALLGSAASLSGQTFGEIAGEVRDPSGSIVAGSDVKVISKGTGAERTTVTNSVGFYSFPALQPGLYDITVSKPGFQSVTRTDLQLQVQQTARVDFALQLGQTTQVLEVTAGAPLLTTENATVGSVIENKRIVDLPLNGRNFLQLISLNPNVSSGFADGSTSVSRLGGSRAQQNISVAGQRSDFNHFTLDGVENTDPTYNTYVFLPSIDALQEFKVQTGIYPAEFGRAITQVNVSTKSGTNQFHGTAYEFLRNNKLDAKDYAFTTARPPQNPFKWNQYGFSLGGPVWIPKVFNGRNRLFFMSNFEGYRDRKSLPGVYNVPTLAMRAGNFAGLTQLFYPGTRAQTANGITAVPIPGNIIPDAMIDPTARKLLEFIPLPNVNTGSLKSNLQEADPRIINKDQFTQRIDFVENANSNWYGRYSRGSEFQSQAALGNTGTTINGEPRQEMISNSRILSPTKVNEFRISHTGFANAVSTPLANVRNVTGELNIPGIAPPPAAWGVPNLIINPFSTVGDITSGPFIVNNHIFQFVDNFSWVKGKHSIRFGAEIRRDRYNSQGNSNARGSFTISGQAVENPALARGYSTGSGTGMADFLLGYGSSLQTAPALAFGQFRSTIQNYYIDDTWRLHPRVTVTVGLRYENTPPYYDKSEKLINVALAPGGTNPLLINPADRTLHPTLVRIGSGDFYEGTVLRFNPAINVARDGRLGKSGVPPDNNDFAPRLGIAWSPTDRWTIRSGLGMFYVQDIASLYFDLSRNAAGSIQINSDTSFPNLRLGNPLQTTAGQVPLISTPAVLGIDEHKRTPYMIEYLFNVQRQLTADTVLEVGYLGNEAHHLMSYVPFNAPLPSPIGTPLSRAPYPEINIGSWVQTGFGSSNYQSLGVKLQHRYGQGLTLMTSYTWSKSIDPSSGSRAHGGDQGFHSNEYCLRCDRGLSNFNVAHRLVTSTLYELPIGRGKALLNRGGVANAVFGGWQISSILTLQTGLPATVISGYDSTNTNSTVARPNATGDTVALPRGQQDPNRWFNTSAFVRPLLGTNGTVGRNTVIGPGIINWDISALKNFQIREGQQLQFRWETFNATNHPNWGLPNTTLTDPTFGVIRSTRIDMRDMQVGLKYIF